MTAALYGLAAVVIAAALGLAGVLRTAKPAEHTADVQGLTALLAEMRTTREDDRRLIAELRATIVTLNAKVARLETAVTACRNEVSRLKEVIAGLRAALSGREPPDAPHP